MPINSFCVYYYYHHLLIYLAWCVGAGVPGYWGAQQRVRDHEIRGDEVPAGQPQELHREGTGHQLQRWGTHESPAGILL